MPAVETVWKPTVWGAGVWGAHVWPPAAHVPPIAFFSVHGEGYDRTLDSSGSYDKAGIRSRVWDFGDGTIAGNIVAPTHTFPAGLTYTVTLTVTNVGGLSTSWSSEVTITAPCEVITVPDGSGTGGGTTPSLTDVSSGVSAVRICNMALAHCGVSSFIEAIDQRSKEARLCNLFYAPVRDEVLGDFAWPFAKRVGLLGLVVVDPTVEWKYAYRYPGDALVVRRVQNGISRLDTPSSRVVFHVGSDASGLLIYSDQPNAEIEYTATSTDPLLWPPDFVMAVSLKLAAAIAPALMSDGATKSRVELLGLYEREIGLAHARAANESQPDYAPESEFITSRN